MREASARALAARDGADFACHAENAVRHLHVFFNAALLRERGMYEAALAFTYNSGRASPSDWALLFRHGRP